MKSKKIPHGKKLPVRFTLHERDIIRNETYCDPDFARIAVVEDEGISVEMSLDEIEDIQGYSRRGQSYKKQET